jgi:hypothetical protein
MNMLNLSKPVMLTAVATLLAFAAASPSAYAATASIKVENQKLIDGTVTVTNASLPKDGFLVIHAADAKGALSEKTLGEIPLKAGDHASVKVKLASAARPGEKLWAVIHEDTGKKGTFEYGKSGKTDVDVPMKADNQVVDRSFMIN